MNAKIIFSQEAQQALTEGRPLVALESTIISHGMPYPQNLEVALEVEETVRQNGAVPVTMAIVNGELRAGLNADELDKFANTPGIMKCSRRDLPFVVSKKLNGATTVAATMILAEMAGITVFATGGIGGVHRQAETTFDVSADLPEFQISNVAVVSAGAKAILDLPKTLETLETLGVPVIGYGTNDFPAFYYPSSGEKVPMRLDTPEEVASFLNAKWNMGLKGGALIANPIPQAFALDAKLIESAIQSAIQQADAMGIKGKETTPFLLKKLNEITAGESQIANKALVLNNAKVAAQIAVAMHHTNR